MTTSSKTNKEWEKEIDLLCRDWEMGNIDDRKSFNAWKKQLKDLLSLVQKQTKEEMEKKYYKNQMECNELSKKLSR